MKKKLSLIFALAVLGSSASAMSVNSDRVYDTQVESKYPVSFSISTGVLNGESEEYAYSNYWGSNEKESKLTWDLKNVFMVGAESSIGVSNRLSLNFGGWINAGSGSGDMTNYDWMNGEDYPWTDRSEHSTNVEEAMMLDINIDFIIAGDDTYKFSGVLGFRHDKFRWNANNGHGTYGTSIDPGDRGQDAEFYGKAISYKQELYAPYLGVNFDFKLEKMTIRSYVRASVWAWGEATDTHYSPAGKYTLNKDLYDGNGNLIAPKGTEMYRDKGEKRSIKDEVEDMFYVSFGLGVDYQFTERLIGGLSADFQRYNKEEDSDRKKYDEYGYEYEGWGGMSHVSYMFSASLKYMY